MSLTGLSRCTCGPCQKSDLGLLLVIIILSKGLEAVMHIDKGPHHEHLQDLLNPVIEALPTYGVTHGPRQVKALEDRLILE